MQRFAQDKNSSKLRTRGTTGLQQLLDKDPRVISEGHVIHMMSSLKDASPMVREATLSLLSNCVTKDHSLERHVLPNILEMTIDPSNGPKKKAIKLLKDIYLRSTSKDSRLSIAASLLLPSQDDESTISELSRSVLEEIWLTAKPSGKADDSQQRLDRTQRAAFMVDLLERVGQSTPHTEAFEKFFVYSLSPETKGAATNSRICKDLVEDLLDSVIEAGTDNPQTRIMNTLAVFAKIKPTLFTVGNLQHLKMYITTIGNEADIALLRPTVVVFRHVLPTLSSLQQAFADDIRGSLMTNLVKLATAAAAGMHRSKETLLDVVHCIWAISGMPDMDARRIFTTLSSVIYQLFPLITRNKECDPPLHKRLRGYLILLGAFGQVCNIDAHSDAFFANLQNQALKNPEVAKQYIAPVLAKKPAPSLLLLHAVRPFTMQAWDLDIREQALESMGGICHQSPELFMRAEVEKVVKLVFVNTDNDRLRLVALSFFNQYFTFAERRSETGAQIAVGKGATNGSVRLETSFVANGNDSATMHLAQRFLPDFVDAALKNNNELAILATNIIASISRQGLVHPKECGAALVALGTSRNPKVAQMASEEHRRIHEKQESYLEKEYMQAIHMAFKYQVDVFKDPHGMVEATHAPKLLKLFEALKTGKKASLKKFIANFVKQIDFDLPKLDASSTSDAVLYARFCLENLALLDFPHWEELAVFLNAVETMVLSTTGPAVGVVIADELPKKYVSMDLPQDMLQPQLLEAGAMPPASEAFPRASQLAPPTIGDDRLRQLTTACMILQLVWETRSFVRRCYTVKSNGPIPQKDYAKPANRNNFITSKDLMERFAPIMRALDSRESMVKQCYEFADLLDVDREAFIEADGDDTVLGAGYETPTEDNNTPLPTSGRGRKRKSNVSLGNTPKKARGRSKKKRSSKTPDGDGESD
jgi:cohesin loading factor subunit SCC2